MFVDQPSLIASLSALSLSTLVWCASAPRLRILLVGVVLSVPIAAAEPVVGGLMKDPPHYMDQWVATDALGRKVTEYQDTTDRRAGKWVGILYMVWVGNHTRQVFDITKILQQPKEKREWGPVPEFHFWGEPEYGYFHASDPWVIRHDMQLLANARVDFLVFDMTNIDSYCETVHAICAVIAQMRKEGIAAPAICYNTHTNSGRMMNRVYDELYGKKHYPELWFRWKGKPLILGNSKDPELRPEVREFFTIRESWVGAPNAPMKDYWAWLCQSPQGYGYSEAKDKPEQVSVTTAFHPANPHGKSYHQGKQPPVNEDYATAFTDQGLFFEEQWTQAHKIDPQVVMITQWNEWIAQRRIWDEHESKRWKGTYGGRPMAIGDSHFVDVFSKEFSRDIAPMKGGYTDCYYYQLVSHIRRFKGMDRPLPRPQHQTMAINGQFAKWQAAKRVEYDPAFDTLHRRFMGTDPKTIYVNETGRNDIIECRTVRDPSNVFFYVKTREPMTPATDPMWMMLFIDIDQSKATGWEGYDLVVNHTRPSAGKCTMEKWNGTGWTALDTGDIACLGNELELRIPARHFRPTDEGFEYKWADSLQHLRDASAFFLDGDVAPDRRFNYRY